MAKTKENSRWIRGQRIGRGSFGTVSVGFDRQDGRVFAVKSVAVSSGTAAQVEAIENEIAVLRSLSSPFVVKYYSDDTTVEPTAATVYRNLHMEYLSGGTAADLAKSGAGDEELIRQYTWCLVSALRYIHSRGIIHCDVKGRNVLLGPTPGIAKLADFGTAKKTVDGERTVKIVPRGSPLWMAPEVVRGESQDYASDVWGLGCTVIEMMTGAPAWRDEGADTLSRIGYSDELPRFPTRLSGLGADFVEKCLRRDPEKRWSCDQLLQHPFLCLESTVQIGDSSSSPCSVIGWPRLEIFDDEDEEDELEWGFDFAVGSDSTSVAAGDRIGKLAGLGGANWESDGWVEVRGGLEEDSYAGFSADEEAGTSSEFSESLGVKEEFESYTQEATGGGCCVGEGSVAEVESGKLVLTAVETLTSSVSGELLFLLLFILCYANHMCYYNYEKYNRFSIFHLLFSFPT